MSEKGKELQDSWYEITTVKESPVGRLKTRISSGFISVRRALERRLPENIETRLNYEAYIQTGLEAIKASDYGGAIAIFSESEAASQNAEKAGFILDYRPKTMPTPSSIEGVEACLDVVGNNSWFRLDYQTIQTSNMEFYKDKPLPSELDELMYHNIALLNAEEWIHGLQFLGGKFPKITLADNVQDLDETELAAYLVEKGIPLTDRFLQIYDRREHLQQNGYKI